MSRTLFTPATIALIAAAIPLDTAVTARQIEALLPLHYCRSTVRGVLALLAREGRAAVEEVEIAQYRGQKIYRLTGAG